MWKIFAPDRPLSRLLTRLVDLCLASLLWALFSVPVVTIGAATAALDRTVAADIGDDGVIKTFCRTFKKNARQGCLLTLLILLILAVLGVSALLLHRLQVNAFMLFRWLYLLLAVFMLMIATYLFPYLAWYEDTVANSMKIAAALSIRHFFTTLLLLLLNILATAAVVLVPIAIVLIPACWALLSGKLTARAFKCHSPTG